MRIIAIKVPSGLVEDFDWFNALQLATDDKNNLYYFEDEAAYESQINKIIEDNKEVILAVYDLVDKSMKLMRYKLKTYESEDITPEAEVEETEAEEEE